MLIGIHDDVSGIEPPRLRQMGDRTTTSVERGVWAPAYTAAQRSASSSEVYLRCRPPSDFRMQQPPLDCPSDDPFTVLLHQDFVLPPQKKRRLEAPLSAMGVLGLVMSPTSPREEAEPGESRTKQC
jgi:hypothetical protein